MSLKAELETWAAALTAYDENDFEKALNLFERIADSSKILTNMGLIYATLGEHEAAVENFNAATSLDQYLAVAYFQAGVSNFLLARYDMALNNFEDALLYLRGNQAINYEQLGLKFRLYSAEVLFNKGLSQVYLGRSQEGIADMEEARREKVTEEHNVIDDAIQDRGEGYTVFSIPVGILYRPNENKIKNAKTKDYLGKAKLVAAADASDAYTTFTGVTRLQQGLNPSGAAFVDSSPKGGRGDAGNAAPRLERQPTQITPAPRGGAGLERQPTQINVAPPSAALQKSNSLDSGTAARKQGPPTQPLAPGGLPARGLSIRKNDGSSPKPPAGGNSPPPPPPEKGPGRGPARLTEIYDDYIDSYLDEEEPPLPPEANRVAAWAKDASRQTAGGPAGRPTQSRQNNSAPPSSYGGPGSVAPSVRRRLTRRPTRATSRAGGSTYDEEEEGYVSGEYDDMPFEMIKIRVKIHYGDDVRGMALTPETPYDEFVDKVTQKFGKAFGTLGMKFKDEDGGKVSLRDDTDYELAIETARESARGKPEGKLEIWCTDQ